MKWDPAFIASRIHAMFRNRSEWSSHKCNIFDNLDQPTQNLLISHCQLMDGEIPLLARCHGNSDWTILTTERVCWEKGSYDGCIHLDSIDKVQEWPVSTTHPLTARLNRNQLVVLLRDSRELGLPFDPGEAMYAFKRAVVYVLKNRHRLKDS